MWHSCPVHLLCSEASFSIANISEKTFYSFTVFLMFHFSPFFFPVLRPLTKTYQEVVRSVFTSSTSSSGASRRQTMKDLQEEFSNLYNNIRLFEKGIKHFTGTINIYFKKWIWFFKDVEFIPESAFKVKEDQQFKKEELRDVFTLPNTDLMLECIGLHTSWNMFSLFHVHSLSYLLSR